MVLMHYQLLVNVILVIQMEIKYCPVVRPTWKQFQNFREFVEHLDATYKQDYGMVKVIPPPQWKPRGTDLSLSLKNLMISGPIEQNVFGKGGIYECIHIPKKSLTFEEYKLRNQTLDKITDNLSAQEVQTMFWKNIAFCPPLYGADLLNTLMDQTAGKWNMSNLDSVLQDSMENKVKGVNTPYCYVGSWKAFFCWHTQDLDLSGINYIHEGKSKFWYSIPYNDRHIITEEAKWLFPAQFSKCPQFLRHKTTLISPYYLKKKYPQLRISKIQHKANEFMFVFGGSYHTGFNFGFNIAEAVNYGTIDWLNKLVNSKSCQCLRSSVRASLTQIYKNLAKSKIKNTKQLKVFQQKVYQIEGKSDSESEDEIGKDRKTIKNALSKQIKKLKKAPKKILYKNEEYKIEHWAQCEKCRIWRLLDNALGKTNFVCKDIGKICSKEDHISKNILTL